MATEFTLPTLGETIESATLVKMLVATGDTVEEDQAVMEVEVDKGVMEVFSTVSGTVGEILVKANDKVKTGQPIFKLGGDAAAAAGQNGGQTAAPAKQEAKVAAPDQAAPPAPNAPTKTAAAAAPLAPQAAKVTPAAPPSNGSAGGAAVAAAPSVRRLARELGIDIAQVAGSGERGRITYADVKGFLQRSAGGAGAGGLVAAPLPDFAKWGEVERQSMSGIRLATARHMARSWGEVAHVTQFDKADITSLEKLRKKYGAQAEKAGGKLTVTAIALKVVATALKQFPQFNASLDLASEQIVLKKYIHIGVAVDTERGLVVPVIRDVDKKSIIELAVELTQIGERARARKVAVEEMQGGSFTITNLGGIGGTAFTPIVNAPEVAILGLARGATEPVWNGTAFEPRLMLPLSLSYDHRVIDGADGARFARFIAGALEEPFLLSL